MRRALAHDRACSDANHTRPIDVEPGDGDEVKGLQIFRAGRHTASDGRVLDFTDAQLKDCAAAYDPALHEAPLVIGHPKGDAPAYGWVKQLAFGETLDAVPHQVDAQFAELVNEGKFKKVSASFYLPDAPGNPKPGKLYLHHVAFLGAQAPAVRGLKSASFAEGEQGIVQFTDWTQRDIASLFRGIRDWIIGKYGKDEADKVIPSYMVDSIQDDAVKAAPSVSYSEETHLDPKQKEELERRERELQAEKDKLARERAEFAERETKFNATQTAAVRAATQRACAEFVDAQVKEGRVLPAQRDGLVAFMASLPEAGIVEFGEGDKAVKKPSAEWLRDYLKAQPKVVDFEERGHRGATATEMDAAEISKRAVEFQETEAKAGRTVSVTAAVEHVMKSART
jgi:hypothetical protein